MLDKPTQRLVLPRAARTPIQVLLMDGARHVAVDALQSPKLPRAQVALVRVAVEAPLGSADRGVVAGQGQHWLGDNMVPIEAAHDLVDLGAVEARRGAAAGLEVDGHAGSGGECLLAEGTRDRAAHVDPGVHMLRHRTSAKEGSRGWLEGGYVLGVGCSHS